MQKDFAIIVTIELEEQKNHGNVLMKSIMHLATAIIVIWPYTTLFKSLLILEKEKEKSLS